MLNVGAGAGSYEPMDRYVLAVEPSATMRAQRPIAAPPAVNAAAERLPFDDDSFDAAMAIMTIHQWSDVDRGLREMRRVSRGRVVVLTLDAPGPTRLLVDGLHPGGRRREEARFPRLDQVIAHRLAGSAEVCVDVIAVPKGLH